MAFRFCLEMSIFKRLEEKFGSTTNVVLGPALQKRERRSKKHARSARLLPPLTKGTRRARSPPSLGGHQYDAMLKPADSGLAARGDQAAPSGGENEGHGLARSPPSAHRRGRLRSTELSPWITTKGPSSVPTVRQEQARRVAQMPVWAGPCRTREDPGTDGRGRMRCWRRRSGGRDGGAKSRRPPGGAGGREACRNESDLPRMHRIGLPPVHLFLPLN
jgi:hypothetical protein